MYAQFKEYYVKVSQLNSSFFVLVKRRRGKILGEKGLYLFDKLKRISEDVYDEYVKFSKIFEQEYFLYFPSRKVQSCGL